MNRLVYFLGFLGVVATGYAPVVLYANQDGVASDVEAAVSRPAPVEPGPANASSGAKDETVAVWSRPLVPAAVPQEEVAAKERVIPAKAEAIYTDALPAVYEGEYDVPIWAVVTLGAKLHSDPDVSSPTTWLYAVGTELNVVGYRRGWYEVIDPASSRRGFIYANYYLEALRGPTSNPVVPVVVKIEVPAAKPAPAPTRTALAEPAPTQISKVADGRQWQSSLTRLAPPEPVQQLAPAATRTNFVSTARPSIAANRESVESLLEKALRR